ncbi:MAG: oxidoreductase [Deltaproteobacteria bacterium]|nr:oxidoreductase [Deltaproteobacteria bacterium]
MGTENKPKLKVAIYWASACGGCCVSVLDVHEKLLDVIALADIVFWPIAIDVKYKNVETMPDRSIDVCLFNGAIRNSENVEMAKMLRQKAKVLVAYGSCAHLGGIPGLANLKTKEEVFRRVYEESESTANSDKIRPQTHIKVPEGSLELPEFYNDVRSLRQVVPVDYFLPGCPPQTERFVEVFLAIAKGETLPPPGSIVGACDKAQCESCSRTRTENKSVKSFHRPWQIKDDGVSCFLEQGVVCMGPATRGGCGNRCIQGNFPCTGCYGPTAESPDPGAGMMSAIATIMDASDPVEVEKMVNQVHDPAGTFYRYSVPSSILRRALR